VASEELPHCAGLFFRSSSTLSFRSVISLRSAAIISYKFFLVCVSFAFDYIILALVLRVVDFDIFNNFICLHLVWFETIAATNYVMSWFANTNS